MATTDVKGTLFWQTGLAVNRSGRVGCAVVKYRNGSTSGFTITNDDGDFNIAGVDDTGDLMLVLLHESGRSSNETIPAGDWAEPLELRMMPIEGRRAPIIGSLTLGAFVVALLLLTFTYFEQHEASIRFTDEQYSALIESLHALPTTLNTAANGVLAARQEDVRDAKHSVDALRTPASNEANDFIERILGYRVAADAEDMNDLDALVQGSVDSLRGQQGRFFWSAWPWVLVELWAWGLFGVLLTKIIRIGWYLRIGSYYANGTWMHIAHVIATPFLALLAVLVLSFVKVEGASETIVDFGNPLFMVVAAALLSTNPWGLWDFVLGQGDALRTKPSAVKTS